MQHNSLYSKQPKDIVDAFAYLKHTVELLEQQPQPGFIRRASQLNGLDQVIPVVEYMTHGTVDEGLPRQVRYGYRGSNGFSEAVTYRDKFWTQEGEVSYALEITAGRNGLLKRSEVYTKNGEVLSSETVRVQAPRPNY